MKFPKLYSVVACAVAVCGFASCSDVTEPVYTKPDASTFKINTPPLQNQYYGLDENGQFEIALNGQPSYGFSAITQYRAEVSLTEDFASYETLTPVGTGTLSRMTFEDSDLATAMCVLHGYKTKEDYKDNGEEKVYFRGVAFIEGIEDSYVKTSNVVSLNRVQGYFAIPVPGYIYVIGNYVGDWIVPDLENEQALKPYTLSEKDDAIGSRVYYGTIDFGENAPLFRFYTALGSWDDNTYGPTVGNNDDNPVVFEDFKAGSSQLYPLMATKDSFSYPNYKGTLSFVADFSDAKSPKVTITAVK